MATVTPIGAAADLLRRYLDRHGRRHTFRPEDDVEPFIRWLRTTDLTTEWRRCRGLAGQITDGGLFDAVAYEYPQLVAVSIERRPMQQIGPSLIRDLNRPTPAELCQVRLQAINMISAMARDDLATVYRLSPRDAGTGGYIAAALAELAAELITATGSDPVEVVEDLRGATIRRQATGGRA